MRSEMTAECGQAVLECICMDDDVLKGLGAARQLQNIVGDAPDELVKLRGEEIEPEIHWVDPESGSTLRLL